MTQEEKQLLFKDLCSRLPYGVIADNPNPAGGAWDEVINIDIPEGTVTLLYDGRTYEIEKIKPYLRPMSNMTDEEKKEYDKLFTTITSKDCNFGKWLSSENDCKLIDFYNSHHFDYRGLIPMGLALEALHGMYKNE